MKWRDRNQSANVDDRRARSGAVRGGLPSIGTLLFVWPVVRSLFRSRLGLAILGLGAAAYAVLYFGGFNLSALMGGGGNRVVDQQQEDEWAAFIKTVHGDLETVWSRLYAQTGVRYRPPTLVLYRGATTSACGTASSRMGPFYCPLDEKVYVDLGFFDDMATEFKAGGDFAQAYVLAHEVGHHIQNLAGTLDQVERAKQQAWGEAEQNRMQVKLELQADCYAGIWANHAHRQFAMLEPGDLEEALVAAAAIGDDRLQQQTRGFAIPHTFTHGSSKERVAWFTRGIKTGRLSDCDTLAAR